MENYIEPYVNNGEQIIPIGGTTLGNTPSKIDLQINDGEGNAIVQYKEGHIKTKDFDSKKIGYSLLAKIERGGILSDGTDNTTISSYRGAVKSSFFLKIENSNKISIRGYTDVSIWEYDSSYNLIGTLKHYNGNSIIYLNSNTLYFRFCLALNSNITSIEVEAYGINSSLKEVKRPRLKSIYEKERIVYHVKDDVFTTAILTLPRNYEPNGKKSPLIIYDGGDGSFTDWHHQGHQAAGIVTGEKYLADEGFAILKIYSWGSYYWETYRTCSIRSAMPIPTHLATHEKGVEYVKSRFNIDEENIFHLSKSGSGKIASFYSMEKPRFNLKSIYAMAPVIDDLNFIEWTVGPGYRAALFKELNMQGTQEEVTNFLEGTYHPYDVAYKEEHGLTIELTKMWFIHEPLGRSFIEKNAEKFSFISVDWHNQLGQTLAQKISDTHTFSSEFWEGYKRYYNSDIGNFGWRWEEKLPATRNDTYNRNNLTRIGCQIPFTVIMSPTDEQCPYWNALEFVDQLRNGGCDAKMITLETGGHSAPNHFLSGPNAVTDITTRLGIHYDAVPIGFYITCEDIYKRFLT